MEQQENKVGVVSAGATPSPSSFYPTVLMIEVIGETGTGKSHFASKISPNPVMFDTTAKGEGKDVFSKVMKSRGVNSIEGIYFHIVDWDDLITRMNQMKSNFSIKTIIVDTSTDLQRMATKEYLERASKGNKQRQAAIQIEYGKIRDMVDVEFIFKVTALPPGGQGKNLIVTSHMKNEYKQVIDSSNNVKAIVNGRQRDGYARAEQQSDIRLFISIRDVCKTCEVTTETGKACVKCGQRNIKVTRFIGVVKNRFRNIASEGDEPEEWIQWVQPQNLEGIKKLLKGEIIVE